MWQFGAAATPAHAVMVVAFFTNATLAALHATGNLAGVLLLPGATPPARFSPAASNSWKVNGEGLLPRARRRCGREPPHHPRHRGDGLHRALPRRVARRGRLHLRPRRAARGADDFISGLVALLAAADALSGVAPGNLPMRRIVFAAFQGEAYGAVGSRKFVADVANFTCRARSGASGRLPPTPADTFVAALPNTAAAIVRPLRCVVRRRVLPQPL